MPSTRSFGILDELKHTLRSLFPSQETKHQKKRFKDLFKADFLAEELPYLQFDEETEIFVNQNSVGFTLELRPPVGISDTLSHELDTIFE